MQNTASGLQNWPLPSHLECQGLGAGRGFHFQSELLKWWIPLPPSPPKPQAGQERSRKEWGWVGVVWGRRTGL